MILLELSFLEHQTFKREEVNKYTCGCNLDHNYNFLKGLDAAVVFTCIILFSLYTQPQSCSQVGTQQPQNILSKGKENVHMLQDP